MTYEEMTREQLTAQMQLLRYLMGIAQKDGAAVWNALFSELYDKCHSATASK